MVNLISDLENTMSLCKEFYKKSKIKTASLPIEGKTVPNSLENRKFSRLPKTYTRVLQKFVIKYNAGQNVNFEQI